MSSSDTSNFKDSVVTTVEASSINESDTQAAKASLEETFPDDFAGLTDDPAPPEDLNYFVTDLLEQMQKKFSNLGSTINSRMDDMGTRIDDLENSINELIDSTGLSEQTSAEISPGVAGTPSKKKSDE